MPDFTEIFEKSSGQPTQYKDSVVRLSDFIPVEDKDEFLLTFERFGSEWIQGVSLGLLDNKGSITISGNAFDKGCGIWQDTTPKKVSFQVTVKQGKGILMIYNTWRNERGIVHSMYYGAAMVRENIENGARYRCNDGHPDEDFDDLIFTLVKTKGTWELPLKESPLLKTTKNRS